jgi:hypothetical protein
MDITRDLGCSWMALGLCKKRIESSLRAPALVKPTSQASQSKLEKLSLTKPRGKRPWPESFVIRACNFILLNTTFDPSNLI